MSAHRSNWPGILLGLGLAWFAAYQQFKLPPALPVMLEAYAYDRTLAGAFMSVYALAGLLLSLPLGRLVERRGALVPVLLALALMGVGGVLTLAWPAAGAMVLGGRGLEGIAFAVLAIVGPVLANTNASRRHLPIVIGLTAAWIPVGQLSAVVLAPAALAVQGWQTLWLFGLVLAAALAGCTWRLAASGRVRLGPRHPGHAHADAGAAGLSAGQRVGLVITAGIFMLWACQYFAFMTWLPQMLVEAHGLDMTGALIGYGLPIAILIAFNMITAALLRAGVPVAPLFVGALATQAAVWWILPTATGWPGAVALAVYGAGAGVVPTCLFAMPSAIAGTERGAARAFGIMMTGRNIGVLAGPILLAQVFAATGRWETGGPVLGSLTALALALSLPLALRLRGVRYGTSR